MDSGNAVLAIIKFFISMIGQVVNVMNSFYILPGVTYFQLLIALSIISIVIKLVSFGIERNHKFNDLYPFHMEYQPRHSAEYVAKHSKTGVKIQNKIRQTSKKRGNF